MVDDDEGNGSQAGVGMRRSTTTSSTVNKLNQEINLALADATIKQHIAELGDTPLALSAADFGKLIADETEKWGKVIRALNIKL
jgi:tripartite-type tricarboxylate transporter receptor subunit TctC